MHKINCKQKEEKSPTHNNDKRKEIGYEREEKNFTKNRKKRLLLLCFAFLNSSQCRRYHPTRTGKGEVNDKFVAKRGNLCIAQKPTKTTDIGN